MLKKQYRLTKNKEFEAVSQSKKSGYTPVLMFKFIKNNLSYSRFGFVVSNKVTKKAPQRNLIRRRIREIIRLNIKKISRGYDFIIIVSPKIINKEGKVLPFSEIEKYVINAFKKANLIWKNF